MAANQLMFLPGPVEHTACRALGLLRQEVPQTVFGSTERRTASLPGIWPASSTMAVAIPTAMLGNCSPTNTKLRMEL